MQVVFFKPHKEYLVFPNCFHGKSLSVHASTTVHSVIKQVPRRSRSEIDLDDQPSKKPGIFKVSII